MQLPAADGEMRRGWQVLAACGVGIGFGLSPLPAYTAGIFALALHTEFGWSRGAILASITFVTAALVLLGPGIGRLTDRIGARAVALTSTGALGIALCLLSLTTEQIWTFYLGWTLLAVVSLGTLPITYAKVISRWFDRRRGLALGIALCTTGITGVLAPIYVQHLIANFGWRVAYLGLGALPIVIALPVLFLFLRDAPPGGVTATIAAPQEEGLSVRAALHGYRFWVMGAAALAVGFGLGGMIPNLVPLLVDRGLSATDAAQLFGIVGISVVAGRLASGWSLDHLWAPLVAAVVLAAAIAAMLILASGRADVVSLATAAVLIGIGAGAEFDLIAYMTSRYFGRRHFAELYAIQYALFGVGSGVAPALFGHARDVTGSYTIVLFGSAVLFAAASAALFTLGRYPPDTNAANTDTPLPLAKEAP